MKCIGFSDKTIKWFHSYLTYRAFFVSLGTVFVESGTIKFGASQGSILDPFVVFNIHKWYLPGFVKYSYVPVWKWYNLFGENKRKFILFSRDKNLPELKITYDNKRTKQRQMVEYLGCCLDVNLMLTWIHPHEISYEGQSKVVNLI